MDKIFGKLSDFPPRSVELYRSSDLHNTAIYFTDVPYEDRKTALAFFELLKFDYFGGPHQVYIRFPNEDFFTEIFQTGFGSGRGTMTIACGKNVWGSKYQQKITIHQHAPNLLLSIGESLPEFNFMQRVAYYNRGNPFNNIYSDEIFDNYEELKQALSLTYLKLPENVRKVQYYFQFKNDNNKYIVVDYPCYNFQYNNHRLFLIENMNVQEYTIKSFKRYRDGGTTIITGTNSLEEEFQLFSPTKLGDNIKVPTWNNTEELEEVLIKETKCKLISLLNIVEEQEEEEE